MHVDVTRPLLALCEDYDLVLGLKNVPRWRRAHEKWERQYPAGAPVDRRFPTVRDSVASEPIHGRKEGLELRGLDDSEYIGEIARSLGVFRLPKAR